MRITTKAYFKDYQNQLGFDLESVFNSMDFDNKIDFISAAVFSCNIEGNDLTVQRYIDLKPPSFFELAKDFQEIENVTKAYEFAKANKLTAQNFLKAHQIITWKLLKPFKQGAYRNDRMGVFDENGLVYLAIEPEFVEEKMRELFVDIDTLLQQDLTITELFYHAALLHLKFVHIHPFWDGNGRAGRLLEKWFLAAKINSRAWQIQSEKYYKENLKAYYKNINLGVNYYELDYSGCLDFLMMLGKSLNIKQ